MRRTALYSSSRRSASSAQRASAAGGPGGTAAGRPRGPGAIPASVLASAASTAASAKAQATVPSAVGAREAAAAAPARGVRAAVRRWLSRHERAALFGAGVALATALSVAFTLSRPLPRELSREAFDEAVIETLNNVPLPSQAARAYEVIRPSVVRVRGFAEEVPRNGKGAAAEADEEDDDESVGSGVVIVENGTILTNLHVVAGAKRIQVVFFDGHESEAVVIGMQPENDLAVLRAKSVPDDVVAATLRSTADLAIGDRVVAVGFPFGIGPSVSAGVVSGLRREYQSPEGKRVISNLIQFDAAANPGNSGGPLVTSEGEVVGIVTGILNPTSQRVFVGIAFAVPIESAAAGAGIPPY